MALKRGFLEHVGHLLLCCHAVDETPGDGFDLSTRNLLCRDEQHAASVGDDSADCGGPDASSFCFTEDFVAWPWPLQGEQVVGVDEICGRVCGGGRRDFRRDVSLLRRQLLGLLLDAPKAEERDQGETARQRHGQDHAQQWAAARLGGFIERK